MKHRGQSSEMVPSSADRWRFWGLACVSFACAWASCICWVLAAFQPVQAGIHHKLVWTHWIARSLPHTTLESKWSWVYTFSKWQIGTVWDSSGVLIRNASDSVSAGYFLRRVAEDATWGMTIAPVESSEYYGYPIWIVIAMYHIAIVWLARSIAQRFGNRHRLDLPQGHLFWARWPEFWTAVVSGVMCIPLFALWRIERGVWEASFVTTPAGAGAWVSVEMWRGAMLAMLVQIAIIHWLIVWHVHRWSLARDRSPVRSRTVWEMARCPWCGYETASERCSECGADRNDPRSLHPRVWIPWIENRAWARWVFRTPTALGAIVFLFFSPVWVPAIRMGVRAMFP